MIKIIIFLIIIAFMAVQRLRGRSKVIGNWNHLFPDLKQYSEEFYTLVEEILNKRKIPGIRSRRRTFKQGSVLSHHRLYLEVTHSDNIFHICAAPWGTGFFFSWWMREKLSSVDEILIMIPIIGPLIVRLKHHKSYYKLDTDAMFRSVVHTSVLDAIDNITETKGVRGLSELERKPDLRRIIK